MDKKRTDSRPKSGDRRRSAVATLVAKIRLLKHDDLAKSIGRGRGGAVSSSGDLVHETMLKSTRQNAAPLRQLHSQDTLGDPTRAPAGTSSSCREGGSRYEGLRGRVWSARILRPATSLQSEPLRRYLTGIMVWRTVTLVDARYRLTLYHETLDTTSRCRAESMPGEPKCQ